MNTRKVWSIILVILSHSNVVKSGWGNNVLKYGSFSQFLKAYCCKSGYLERFTNFSKTKLNKVYNTLKFFLGSIHLLTITMATMMHPFQKAKMDNNSMKVFFVLKT